MYGCGIANRGGRKRDSNTWEGKKEEKTLHAEMADTERAREREGGRGREIQVARYQDKKNTGMDAGRKGEQDEENERDGTVEKRQRERYEIER